MAQLGKALDAALNALSSMGRDELRRQRREKFLAMGRL
jgi:acetyl-CoA carboxylase alpha subunit